jgi:hypothetical protein
VAHTVRNLNLCQYLIDLHKGVPLEDSLA